jgi:hypothetical protein
MYYLFFATMIICIIVICYASFMMGVINANNKNKELLSKKDLLIQSYENSIAKYEFAINLLQESNDGLIASNDELRKSYQLYIDNVEATLKDLEQKYGVENKIPSKNRILN